MRADSGGSNGVIAGRLARSADPAGPQDQPGTGGINRARAIADTDTASVKPAGAAPVGSGGPFVGPYLAAGGKPTLTPNSGPAGTSAGVSCSRRGLSSNGNITIKLNGKSPSTSPSR